MGGKLEVEKPNVDYPFYARVIKNERITSKDHFQDTRHIALNVENLGIEYAPGDVLCMHPLTPWDTIDDFIGQLGLDRLSKVAIKSTNQDQSEVFYVRSLIQGNSSFNKYLGQSLLV